MVAARRGCSRGAGAGRLPAAGRSRAALCTLPVLADPEVGDHLGWDQECRAGADQSQLASP